MNFIWIQLLHWIGDFVLQTRYLADRKSKDIFILVCHVLIYGLALSLGVLVLYHGKLQPEVGKFLIINILCHFLVDFFTSRLTSKLYKDGHMYCLFTTIGFDQWLHNATLFGSYYLLLQ